MAERYEKLLNLPADLYTEGSPVIVKAGALLKDTLTNKVIVQLKFLNLGEKQIDFLTVKLYTYDPQGNKNSEPVEFQYMDLHAKPYNYFGEKTPIVLEDNAVRNIDVSVTKIIFSDKTTQELSEKLEPIEEIELLDKKLSDEELLKQYRIEADSNGMYIPKRYKDLFYCDCGRIGKTEVCRICGCNINRQIEKCNNTESLKEKSEIRLKKEREIAEAARIEAERKAEEKRIEAEGIAKEKRIAAEKARKKRNKIIAIVTPIVIACIVFIIVLTTVIIPNVRLKTAKIGNTIKFGTYEQDNNAGNGKEKIEWIVLDKADNKIFVISKYAFDYKRYNEKYTDVTWESCTLRKWLNNDFFNTAFSAEERALIPTISVYPDKNPKYNTNPGKATDDKIFLLSITEAEKYFTSDSARACKGTEYCDAQGDRKTNNGNCRWWLRSPGAHQDLAARVQSGGEILYKGETVHGYNDAAVRPAMWISLEP